MKTPSNDEQPQAAPLQDYLEKYASEGLKREVDYEEAVWRSLPAFVTALGLLLGLLAYSVLQLSVTLPHPVALAGIVVAPLALGAAVLAVWELGTSVEKQRHRYPPSEVELVQWAQNLRDHYGDRDDDAVKDSLVLRDVREHVLNQTAQAAAHNHLLNAKKLRARTRAARGLFWCALFTIVVGSLSVGSQIISDQPNHARRNNVSPATTATATATAGTSASLGREGQHRPITPPLAAGGLPADKATTPPGG